MCEVPYVCKPVDRMSCSKCERLKHLETMIHANIQLADEKARFFLGINLISQGLLFTSVVELPNWVVVFPSLPWVWTSFVASCVSILFLVMAIVPHGGRSSGLVDVIDGIAKFISSPFLSDNKANAWDFNWIGRQREFDSVSDTFPSLDTCEKDILYVVWDRAKTNARKYDCITAGIICAFLGWILFLIGAIFAATGYALSN
ncbi:MAG: hypothetical protein AAGE65_07050 [Planctomycetota bacterium]